MKHRVFFAGIALLSILIFQSCNNKGPVLHTNISGKANDLVVVISEDSWNGKPGELIRADLGQFQVSLPQEEPLFQILNIPPDAFKKIFKSNRNIMQVTVSTTVTNPGIVFKEDLWAYPQAIIEVKAQNLSQFEELFNKDSAKIINFFLAAEQERLTMNYDKYYEKTVFNKLNTDFGVTMKVPPGFVIAMQQKDFLWYRYETPEISQGIALFTLPYQSDSTFTAPFLIAKTDSVLKAYITGTLADSYMAIEKRIEPAFRVLEHNKNYAAEMRGLWVLENDFMGGPYLLLAELDASNQRVVVAFGYVYAPSKEKRNYLQQVEAMIYSLKMNQQDKNDKINSQVKMGN